MATPRSNIVKLRLTDLEKADWQKAAGGSRLLSDFIRRVVNAECERLRGEDPVEELVALGVEKKLEQQKVSIGKDNGVTIPPPTALPPAPASSSAVRVRNDGKDAVRSDDYGKEKTPQCPRWMHHRPGVYCGSCKKVIEK